MVKSKRTIPISPIVPITVWSVISAKPNGPAEHADNEETDDTGQPEALAEVQQDNGQDKDTDDGKHDVHEKDPLTVIAVRSTDMRIIIGSGER